MRCGKALVLLAAVPMMIMLALLEGAHAQKADGDAASAAALAMPGEAGDALSLRAAQIDQLVEGTLDPAIAAQGLLTLDFAEQDGTVARAVLRLVSDSGLHAKASADPAALAPLSVGQAKLALALARFLRLPQERRNAILDAQAAKVAKLRQPATQAAALKARLASLQRELDELQAFLAGKPANPELLRLDFARVGSDIANPAMLAALKGEEGQSGSKPAEDAPLAERIAWTQLQVDRAWGRILALSPQRLAQLQFSSGIVSDLAGAIADADAALSSAQRELRDAQALALQARSEQMRLLANERARLAKVASVQARLQTELARGRGEPAQIADDALVWRRKVRDLAARADEERPTVQADELYAQLVADLQRVRAELRAALDASTTPQVAGLVPAPIDDALPETLAARRELVERRAELVDAAQRLRERHAEQLWARRNALRDAMVLLNEQRLDLIGMLSPARRAQVTGFGSEGVAQARRELSQITLALRFEIMTWQRLIQTRSLAVIEATPTFVFEIVRLLLLVLAFRWWRRRGETVLGHAQHSLAQRRPSTLLTGLQVRLIEYVRRVRRPLDWLVFSTLVYWVWPEHLALRGLAFVWIILFWSLTTVFLLRLFDALARGRGKTDPHADLRWRSLRLVGGGSLAVGLVLGLTVEAVGKGAIYHWVLDLCWLLVPGIILILAHWWRARIVALARQEARESVLLTWVGRDPGGPLGLMGRAVAGAVLLATGAQAILVRRIRDLVLIREIIDQRARTSAARQVAEDKASGRYHRISYASYDALDPHRSPSTLRQGSDRPGGVAVPEAMPGTVSAVVSVRGCGKSAVLHDMAASRGDAGQILSLEADGGGYTGIIGGLAQAIGLPGASEAEVVQGLRNLDGQTLILIDDVQRMIVPAIGGLAEFDRLIRLTRSSGASCAWTFAISTVAWRYVARARADRVLFDAVHHLPGWSAGELRSLIERRTAHAGIEPDFSTLVDEGAIVLGSDITPDERRRRTYFERLADYARGNPAIALEYWRRSLFIDGDTGRVTVRIFDAPDPQFLSGLPLEAMFVLRAILQMDIGIVSNIHWSTQLPAEVVSEALRSLERAGAVVQVDGGYRITLYWLAEVTRMLQRRNLLAGDVP